MRKLQLIKLGVPVLTFLLVIICCWLQSCEKEEVQTFTTVNLDKQIRVSFPFMSFASWSTSGQILSQEFWLIDFNKSNYENVDSILFSASLETSDTTANCIAELFDLTDNIVIPNSLIETNKLDPVWIKSKNIFAGLSDKNIDLSIKLRTDKQVMNPVVIFDAVLLLYRK
jgi:hypothetical protein